MYHIIYKTTSKSGKYYIGRHSTKNLDDGYLGSGKWIRSIKDKSTLVREILQYCASFDELLALEEKYLKENIGKENCMNFNTSSVGFSAGELNPSHSMDEKQRRSARATGENNPSKRPEVRKKISESQKGKPSPHKGKQLSDQARKNISAARTGIKYTKAGREKLSHSRKIAYESGAVGVPTFAGHTHSEETKKKQSDAAKRRTKYQCPHCGVFANSAVLSRWHLDNCKK